MLPVAPPRNPSLLSLPDAAICSLFSDSSPSTQKHVQGAGLEAASRSRQIQAFTEVLVRRSEFKGVCRSTHFKGDWMGSH